MLTRDDYRGYLDQIAEIEQSMAAAYAECAGLAMDPEVKRVCEMLMAQEREHARRVQELTELMGAG